MDIKHTYEVGDTARIEVVFHQQGAFSDDLTEKDPDSMKITIKDEYDGTEVVSNKDMDKHSDAHYYYTWDTAGEDAGDYVVVLTGELGGKVDVERNYIRLE